jgi:hypothetical protein
LTRRKPLERISAGRLQDLAMCRQLYLLHTLGYLRYLAASSRHPESHGFTSLMKMVVETCLHGTRVMRTLMASVCKDMALE